MSDYMYLPMHKIKTGDVVEYTGTNDVKTTGKLYVVTSINYGNEGYEVYFMCDNGKSHRSLQNNIKLVKTLPGSEVQVGDTIVRTPIKSSLHYGNEHVIGETEVVTKINPSSVHLHSNCMAINKDDFKILQKEEPITDSTVSSNPNYNFKIGDKIRRIKRPVSACKIGDVKTIFKIFENTLYYDADSSSHRDNWELVEEPITRRGLAFYKRSGDPWTNKEYANLCKYVGYEKIGIDHVLSEASKKRKYIFDDNTTDTWFYSWIIEKNLIRCKQIAYEDVYPKHDIYGEPITSSEHTIGVDKLELKKYNGQLEINQIKETQMKNITVTIPSEMVTEAAKVKEPKTDLQIDKKLKVTAKYYNFNGAHKCTLLFKTEKEALALLSDPEYTGCTVRIYTLSSSKKQKVQLEDA